jgi:hypothetical protein
MLKRISTIITAGGTAAALAVAPGAAPSSAATATRTWTVNPGGHVTVSGPLLLKDPTTGITSQCKSVKLDATLKSGSGLVGAGIGSISSGSFTSCYLERYLHFSLSVAVNGLPWKLNAASYDAKTGVTTGTITGIDLAVTGSPGCYAVLDGTAAGADNGMIQFTYTNSTGTLKLLPKGGNLHWWAVSGCYGLLGKGGDPVQPSGSLTVEPKQTITSP